MRYFNFSVASFNWRTIMYIECEKQAFSVVTVLWLVNDKKPKHSKSDYWLSQLPPTVSDLPHMRSIHLNFSTTGRVYHFQDLANKDWCSVSRLMYMHWRPVHSRVTEPPLRLGSIMAWHDTRSLQDSHLVNRPRLRQSLHWRLSCSPTPSHIVTKNRWPTRLTTTSVYRMIDWLQYQQNNIYMIDLVRMGILQHLIRGTMQLGLSCTVTYAAGSVIITIWYNTKPASYQWH